MAADESHSDLVEVTRVTSLMEADVIRAALEGHGIPVIVPGALAANTMSHIAGGLNPTGLKILVPADAGEEARALVTEWAERRAARRGEPDEQVEPAESPEGTPDVWARSARRSAMFALIIPIIFIPMAFYSIGRARREARRAEPVNREKFDNDLALARPFVWLAVLVYLFILLMIAQAEGIPAHLDGAAIPAS